MKPEPSDVPAGAERELGPAYENLLIAGWAVIVLGAGASVVALVVEAVLRWA